MHVFLLDSYIISADFDNILLPKHLRLFKMLSESCKKWIVRQPITQPIQKHEVYNSTLTAEDDLNVWRTKRKCMSYPTSTKTKFNYVCALIFLDFHLNGNIRKRPYHYTCSTQRWFHLWLTLHTYEYANNADNKI